MGNISSIQNNLNKNILTTSTINLLNANLTKITVMSVMNYYINNINLFNSKITQVVTPQTILEDLPMNSNVLIKIDPDDTNISNLRILLILTNALNKIILDNLTYLEISKLNEAYYDEYLLTLTPDIICPSIINPYDITVSADLHKELFQRNVQTEMMNILSNININSCIENLLQSYPKNNVTLSQAELIFSSCIYNELIVSNFIAIIASKFNLSIEDDSIKVSPSPIPMISPSPIPMISPSPIPMISPSPIPMISPSPIPMISPNPTQISITQKVTSSSTYIIVFIVVTIILFIIGIILAIFLPSSNNS
jgi:hypothetical protein